MRKINHKPTQREPLDERQVQNNAGGYVYEASDEQRLLRFLILGTEGGTYYVKQRKLDISNVQNLKRMLDRKYKETIDLIVQVSEEGRAPVNDYALFALAVAASHPSVKVRQYALANLKRVARIPTHLFIFLNYVKEMRGWGRALRRAVADWYTSKDLDQLVYHVLKYRQREGWKHIDALRVSHPKPVSQEMDNLFKWLAGKGMANIPMVDTFHQLQSARNAPQAVAIIKHHPWISHEMVPNKFLTSPEVWEALLPNLPIGALIRNLSRLTYLGVLRPLSDNTEFVIKQLTNQERLRAARIHPVKVLDAYLAYTKGEGRNFSWTPIPEITDALEKAFYLSFGNVEPTGKRYMLGVDVSGSMSWNSVGNFTCAQGAAAMAMTIARTEPKSYIMGFAEEFRHLGITKNTTLQEAFRKVEDLNYGYTDCAVPMLYALEHKIPVDVFVVITDNETWYGDTHPSEALKDYRRRMGIDAKLVVIGMVANEFSIADPDDPGMLDVVGFDTQTPQTIAEFVKM